MSIKIKPEFELGSNVPTEFNEGDFFASSPANEEQDLVVLEDWPEDEYVPDLRHLMNKHESPRRRVMRRAARFIAKSIASVRGDDEFGVVESIRHESDRPYAVKQNDRMDSVGVKPDYYWHIGEETVIPLEFRPHITEEQLDGNALRYEEMHWDIDPELLDEAKQRLMQLPLVHRTDTDRFKTDRGTDGGWPYRGLAPASYISNGEEVHTDNTHGLDYDLGLDKFVFFNWGAVYADDTQHFLRGKNTVVLVDPSLIMSPETFVTPNDIAEHTSNYSMDTGYGLSSWEDRQGLRSYMQTMVRGSDWFEIAARRVAKSMEEGDDKGVESALDAYSLGEIKHHGEVSSSKIIGVLDLGNRKEYEMYCQHIKEATGFDLKEANLLTKYRE